jgi:hypothetical protein
VPFTRTGCSSARTISGAALGIVTEERAEGAMADILSQEETAAFFV